MKKLNFTYFMIVLLRLTACFALFNEEFGFAAIWFALSEIINVIDKLTK
jgi:phosphatidylglycerophosphate synthase